MVWHQAAVKGPSLSARFRHSATLVGKSQVYVFGGSGSGVLFNDIAVLDFDQQSAQIATSTPAPLELEAPHQQPQQHAVHLKGEPEFVEVVKLREPTVPVPVESSVEPSPSDNIKEPESSAHNPQQATFQFPALPNGKVPTVEEVMRMYLGMAMALRAEKQQREQLEMSLKKLERTMAEDRLARAKIEESKASVEGELLCVQEAKKKLESAKAKAEKNLKAEKKKNKKDERDKEETLSTLRAEFDVEREKLEAQVQAERRKKKRAKAKLLKLREEKESEVPAERKSRSIEELERALVELQRTREQLKEQEEQNRLLGEELHKCKTSPLTPDYEKMSLEELIKLEDFYHQALKAVGNAKQEQLQRQLEELKRAKAVLEDQKLCSICCDREIRVVLIPCGHRSLCKECSELLQKCPLCRAPITGRIESY